MITIKVDGHSDTLCKRFTVLVDGLELQFSETDTMHELRIMELNYKPLLLAPEATNIVTLIKQPEDS